MLSTTILRWNVGRTPGTAHLYSFGGRVVGSFYIAVCDLSEEELCIILCPDGILLAAKVSRLCKGGDNVGNDTVCLGSTNIFFYFHFYARFGMLSKGMGESFILSEDEPLTPNIDGVMTL